MEDHLAETRELCRALTEGLIGRAGVFDMSELFLLAEGATSAQNLSIFSPAAPAAESIRALFILVPRRHPPRSS